MEKNTVWAIVLSIIVLVGFSFLQPLLYPVNTEIPATSEVEQQIPVAESTISESIISNNLFAEIEEESIAENTYTIKTNKVKVTFTNRGGDIIGYEILDAKDESKNVQMADNISEINRAFAVSLGDANAKILDEIFNVKIINDYTIGFYKNYGKFVLAKTYEFKPDEYMFNLKINIDSLDGNMLNYGGVAYTLRTSPQIGPHYDKKKDRYENRTFMTYNGKKVKKQILADNTSKNYTDSLNWTGITGKYFALLVSPVNTTTIGNVNYSTATEITNYSNAQLKISRNPINESRIEDSYYIYAGPRKESELKNYNNMANNAWNLSNLYVDECLQSSGILSWLEKFLKWVMELLYKLIPNWGVSIIIMTILLKVVLFPLTKKSSVSQLKMQEVQPKMTELQAKYKNQPEKLNQEMAKLYQETGYNPLSGCLPLLIQFPLIIAMFNLFNNYFEFRGAMFIPGWIPDLSTSDVIATLGFNIPLLGNQIHILPVIYLASQLLYGKYSSATSTGGNQTQMKIMMYAMPIVFFFIFYNAPAGLLIYWTISNILTFVQQIAINKIMKTKKAEMEVSKTTKKK